MNKTHKTVALALMVGCTLFMLTREFQVWHHFVVVNRDSFPVMSYFYGQTMLHATAWLTQLAGLQLGLNRKVVA